MPMFSKLVPAALTMSSVFADDTTNSLFLNTANSMEDLSSLMTMSLAEGDVNAVTDADADSTTTGVDISDDEPATPADNTNHADGVPAEFVMAEAKFVKNADGTAGTTTPATSYV